jgi:membrane protein DedA with SNARE-associated domain
MVPFLFAAGAMQYSVRRFLFALTLGRVVRYTLLTFLGAHYGRRVLFLISTHGNPVLIAAIGLSVATAAALIFYFTRKRKKRTRE